MKKNYIAPELMVVKINPQTILAGSDIKVDTETGTESQNSLDADFEEEEEY